MIIPAGIPAQVNAGIASSTRPVIIASRCSSKAPRAADWICQFPHPIGTELVHGDTVVYN
jgi:hypothetical protein